MQNMKILYLMLLVTVMQAFMRSAYPEVSNNSQEQEQIKALLAAVHQAQRPAHNMRVSWKLETEAPFAILENITDTVPHTTREYTVTISGIQSRIEYFQKTYTNKETEEPYDIRRVIYVFDGTRHRNFTDRIKAKRTTPFGFQSLSKEANTSILNQELFACDLPFDDMDKLNTYQFKLVDSNDSDIYILDAIAPGKVRNRFTIDAKRGYNIVKTEWLGKNNRTLLMDEITVKQYAEGTWFPVGRKRIRYYPDGTSRVEHNDRFTRLELNIEIPEETFNLEFPPGTKVWDEILENWFVVGATEQPIIEDELLNKPTPEKTAKETVGNQKEHDSSGILKTKTTQKETKREEISETPLMERPNHQTNFFYILFHYCPVISRIITVGYEIGNSCFATCFS